MHTSEPYVAGPAELFGGPGEMAARCRAFDWSSTALGPVEQWPHSLRTMAAAVLADPPQRAVQRREVHSSHRRIVVTTDVPLAGVGAIAIRDTGIGMTADQIARVFEPLVQFDSHRSHDMRQVRFLATLGALLASSAVPAQQPQTPQPFSVGNPVGLPITPTADRAFEPVSSNVKVYGSIYSAESCSYDAERGVIVVPNRGVPQSVQGNNAWVSFINHDGSVHTARWIGVQSPADRGTLTPPLVLNDPFGSDIINGMLYVADRDGGTNPNEPTVAVIRRFDMRTGAPSGEFRVERSAWLNDIEVANDGTIYATQTGEGGDNPNPATWQVWKVTPDGTASIFVQGAPLNRPNGIAFDPQGNIVVVNVGNADVLTFSPGGQLVKTEQAAQSGSDGLVIMPDGTKYVSSVVNGGVSRIRPGRAPELIARNIPNAASMCHDAGANQLVIPMNPNNGLAFVRLDGARR